MFKRRQRPPAGGAHIETLIGRQVSIQGDIRFRGGLHIDGHVTGSVQAEAGPAGRSASLSLSEHGCVEGSVLAQQVALNGRVEGDVTGAERVLLGSKAEVHGDVRYGVIEMALGARIRGRLIPRSAAASAGLAGASEWPDPLESDPAPADPGSFDAPEGAA